MANFLTRRATDLSRFIFKNWPRWTFMMTFAFIGASFVSAQGVDDNATTYQINVAHSGVQIENNLVPPFALRWQVTLAGIVSYPLIAQGLIYVVANDKNQVPTLYALDQASGDIRWTSELLESSYIAAAGIAYDNGRVFAITFFGLLSAYDAQSGILVWSTKLPYQVAFTTSAPTVSNGAVYVTGAASGATIFQVDEKSGAIRNSAAVEGASSPALSSDAIFLGAGCNTNNALLQTTLQLLWQESSYCIGGTDSTAVYADNRVYTHNSTGNQIVDAATGALLGTYLGSSGLIPAVKEGRLWTLGSQNGGVLAEDVSDPTAVRVLWDFAGDGKLATAPIELSTPNGEYLVVGSETGMLYVLDANSGSQLWATSVGATFQNTQDIGVAFQLSGLAAGNGLLVAPAGNTVSVFANTPTTGYVPVVPSRLLDSRLGGVTVDGAYAELGPLRGGDRLDLSVTGRGGVPTEGVTAVVINVTATEPRGPGFITVWPAGSAQPNASNLNFTANETIPNLVIASVGEGGKISLFNSQTSVSTHLIADVVGYFTGSSTLRSILPTRLLDTRAGYFTVDNRFSGIGALVGPGRLDLDVNGRSGLPVSDLGSIVMNVTVTNPTDAGFVTAWSTDYARPTTSNLNYEAAETIPNLVISPVSDGGQVSFFNSAGNTDLIVDAQAWFPKAAELISVPPSRILDTRPGMPTDDGQFASIGAIGGNSKIDLTVAGRLRIPSAGVAAVVLNITATQSSAAAFVTAWPAGVTQPLASTLNVVPGQTISNLAIVPVGSNNQISLYNSHGQTDVIVDIVGWFPTSR